MTKGPSLVVLSLLLAGCSLTPAYEAPPMPVAASYTQNAAAHNAQPTQVIPDWQQLFGDARLRQLITLGLENNRDLRTAVLNIDRARAQYRIQRSDLLPAINASGDWTRQRAQQMGTGAGNNSQVSDAYTVGIGLSAYEVDLFGRVRSQQDAAVHEYLALEENARAVRLSLIAEIATAYLNQRALSERLALTQQTLENRQESLELVRTRYEYGEGSELAVTQAQGALEEARSAFYVLQRSLKQSDNALVLLTGAPLPVALPAARTLDAQGLDAPLPAGLPSELMIRRPDIRAAEQRLRARYADIGAARAAFFPRISLTASTGFGSSALGGLFPDNNRTWSFMPQISLPIFNAGRLQAELDVAKIQRDLGIVDYEKSIQVAFREVADELVAREPLEQEFLSRQRQQSIASRRLSLAQLRYKAGLDGYLEALESQRESYQTDTSLIEARLQLALSQVNLFKALGGGWQQGAGPQGL